MPNNILTDEGRSPWATPKANLAEIFPVCPSFESKISLPGSKSFTNRGVLIASVAEGQSILSAPLFADDSYWCVQAIQKLGANVECDLEKNLFRVSGVGSKGFKQPNSQRVFIGSAGTSARFLPGLVAGTGQGAITIESTQQLSKRPVKELVEGLQTLGADISFPGLGRSFPMKIVGGSLLGGQVDISGAISSQFTSGLLIAAPLAKNKVTIRVIDSMVQPDYIRITMEVMKKFGVEVEANQSLTKFVVRPQKYKASNYTIEADASTATCFFALAASTQSKLTIDNLNSQTHQPDFMFVRHLESMGCKVEIQASHVVSVTGPKKLKGGQIFDFSKCSDSTAALAVIAPFADDKIQIRGVAHIRNHECDRLKVITQNLTKCGVKVEEHQDGLTIYPVSKSTGFARFETFDDHRIAMAFSILAAIGQGGEILDPACVSKTCPNYFELLGRCGVKSTFK